MSVLTALPPLSLYVHIPWCVQKCPYCDFNSHTFNGELPEKAYVEALLNDFRREHDAIQGRVLQSIFFGGGTPSLMSARGFDHLLSALQKQIALVSDIEITMEANPGTYEHDRFKDYRDVGINRLSIGVQSFQDDKLNYLGRIHSAGEAYQAVASLRDIGFDNVNIDLMHGLPSQSSEDAMADLEQAIMLNPTHISWYQLTIEPNTVFYSKPPPLPEDDTLWSIQEQGWERLAMAGFSQYEISAYARNERQSRHNVNYWTFGDYIGIGAGAHGKVTDLTTGLIYRNWKTRMPDHYLDDNKHFEAGRRILGNNELPIEFLMNALRLNEGVPRELFAQRTGQPLEAMEKRLAEAISKGLLDPERLQPTKQGRLFLNDLLAIFTLVVFVSVVGMSQVSPAT